MSTPPQNARLTATLVSDAFAAVTWPQSLQVLRVEGEDAIGDGFRFDIDVACAAAQDDLAQLLLKPARLAMTVALPGVPGGEPSTTHLSGVITSAGFAYAVSLGGTTWQVHRLRLEPQLARWRQEVGNGVWTRKTAVEAIKEILSGKPTPTMDKAYRLQRKYPPRQNLVRFQESTPAFIARLCAEEGIQAYYLHSDQGTTVAGTHTLVLNDGNADVNDQDRRTVAVAANAPFRSLDGRRRLVDADGALETEARDADCERFTTAAAAGSTAKPAFQPAAFASTAATGDLVARLDPCGAADAADDFTDFGTAAQLAQRRADDRREEAAGHARRLHAGGDHVGLPAGAIARLAEGTHQGDWLVVRRTLRLLPVLIWPQESLDSRLAAVQLRGATVPELCDIEAVAQASWPAGALSATTRIEAVPLARPFRPAPRPAPVLAGVHFATVADLTGSTAQAGMIGTDALGRVRLLFDWAPGQASGLVRVAQGARGLLALPRVGDRVAVAFAYGDPGRPLVAGLTLDKTAALPGDPSSATAEIGRTVLGGGFTSDKGYGTAVPDLHRRADLAISETDGAHLEVPAQAAADGKPAVAAVKSATYASSYLAFEDQVATGKGIDLFTAGTMREQVNGSRTITVGGDLKLVAGTSITLQVGDASIKLTPSGVTIGLKNSTFPAIGPTLTMNVAGITMVAPVFETTGFLRAKMASSGSAYTAQGPYAKANGFSASLNSDLFNCVGDMIAAWTGVFLSHTTASTADTRSAHNKDAEMVYSITKETLLAAADLPKMLYKSLNLGVNAIGTGVVDATAGTTTLRTSPFPSGVGAVVKGVSALAKIGEKAAGSLGKNDDAANAKMGFNAVFSALSLYGSFKDILQDRAELNGAQAPALNKVAVKAMTGVAITATEKSTISMKVDDTALAAAHRQADERATTLQAEHTTAMQRLQALQNRELEVDNQEQAIRDQIEVVNAKRTALDEADQALNRAQTAVANSNKGVTYQVQSPIVQVN